MIRKTNALFLMAFLCSQPAWALRCGNALVVEGDYKYEVLKKCGEPDYHRSWVEYRGERIRGSGITRPGLDVYREYPIVMEEWTYDFGPNRFIELVIFENGRVLEIKPADYRDLR